MQINQQNINRLKHHTCIHEHIIRIAPISRSASGNLRPQAPRPAHAVSDVRLAHIGSWLAQNELVKEVIDEVHLGR